jgi:hypothetical protein
MRDGGLVDDSRSSTKGPVPQGTKPKPAQWEAPTRQKGACR